MTAPVGQLACQFLAKGTCKQPFRDASRYLAVGSNLRHIHMNTCNLGTDQSFMVQVLVPTKNGALKFEKIFMFSHHDPTSLALYITLHTSSGHTLSATPGHYIWVTPARADGSFRDATLTKASAVRVGDYVWIAADSGENLEATQVAEITRGL